MGLAANPRSGGEAGGPVAPIAGEPDIEGAGQPLRIPADRQATEFAHALEIDQQLLRLAGRCAAPAGGRRRIQDMQRLAARQRAAGLH